MFDKDVNISGKHGDYIRHLVAEFEGKCKFFKSGYDAYKNAPIIGFLFGRKANKSSTKEGDTFTIFASQMSNIQDDLIFNYRLIMLLDAEHEPNFDERIQKAFNYYGDEIKSKKDKELFEQYTLGGIEVLYEKLIDNASRQDEYLLNLFSFVQDFHCRFNAKIEYSNFIEITRGIQST